MSNGERDGFATIFDHPHPYSRLGENGSWGRMRAFNRLLPALSTATCDPENHASKRLRGQGFLCQARRIDTAHVEIPYYSQLRNAISFASTNFPQVFHINYTKNF